MITQRTKIGPCHGKPQSKIWIEGKRLAEAGFAVGTHYCRIENEKEGALLLVPLDGQFVPHQESKLYKVSGKGEKPIIDISGAIVSRLFPAQSTHVTVTFRPGTIVISRE